MKPVTYLNASAQRPEGSRRLRISEARYIQRGVRIGLVRPDGTTDNVLGVTLNREQARDLAARLLAFTHTATTVPMIQVDA